MKAWCVGLLVLGTPVWGQRVIPESCKSRYQTGICDVDRRDSIADQLERSGRPDKSLDTVLHPKLNLNQQAAALTAVAPATLPPASAEVLPADWPLWRFADPHATLALGVRIQALLDSPLLQSLGPMVGSFVPGGGSLEQMRKQLAGVEWMMLSVRGTAGRPEVLVLVRGTQPASLAKGQNVPMRYLDPQTVVMGEPHAVNAAIQRVLTPGIVPVRDKHLKDLAVWSDLWYSIDQGFLASLPTQRPAPLAGFTRMSAGIALREQLTAELWLDTLSPMSANKLLAAMHQDPRAVPVLSELGPQINPEVRKEVKGSAVRLYVQFDTKNLVQGMTGQTAATPAEAPKRKTVVIQGMESGTKEVPLEHRQ